MRFPLKSFFGLTKVIGLPFSHLVDNFFFFFFFFLTSNLIGAAIDLPILSQPLIMKQKCVR